MAREDAYAIVQRNAMQAYNGKKGFKELVLSDPDITEVLKADEIEECFDLSYYMKNVDKVFKRVFGK